MEDVDLVRLFPGWLVVVVVVVECIVVLFVGLQEMFYSVVESVLGCYTYYICGPRLDSPYEHES